MKMKIEKTMEKQRVMIYYKSLTYIRDRIKYYNNHNYPKGTREAIEWVESFKYVNGLSMFKQSKLNRNLVKLIVMTCDQEFIYKLHELRNRCRNESMALMEFTEKLRLYLSNQKRSKMSKAIFNENMMKIDESVSRGKLDMQMKKQQEIIELNNNEKKWLERASDKLKLKIEGKGTPTFMEVIEHGKIYSRTDMELNVSVTVTCKLYGYYWVMVTSRARYSITPDRNYEIIPYLTNEQAFQKAKEMFNKEVLLQLDINKKNEANEIKKEKERAKVDIDISNVAKAMGIMESEEDIEDIF